MRSALEYKGRYSGGRVGVVASRKHRTQQQKTSLTSRVQAEVSDSVNSDCQYKL